MIQTPKMWAITNRLDFLEPLLEQDPDNADLQSEIVHLRGKYERMARIERLGLQLIMGGQVSASCTDQGARIS